MSDTWKRARALSALPLPPPRQAAGATALTRPARLGGGGVARAKGESFPAGRRPTCAFQTSGASALPEEFPARLPQPSDLLPQTTRWAGTGPEVLSASHARATQRRDSQSIPSRALQSAPRHAAAPPRPSALAPAAGTHGSAFA